MFAIIRQILQSCMPPKTKKFDKESDSLDETNYQLYHKIMFIEAKRQNLYNDSPTPPIIGSLLKVYEHAACKKPNLAYIADIVDDRVIVHWIDSCDESKYILNDERLFQKA